MEYRRELFNGVLPITQRFLLSLYGTLDNYLNVALDPDNNKHSLLEDVCFLYDRSIMYNSSAVVGLKLLGIQSGDIPMVELYNVLVEIFNNPKLLESYTGQEPDIS